MHQTTCGEIHKIEIFDASKVSQFLNKEKDTFDAYQKNRNCIYSNKKIINNPSLNYLNDFFSRSVYEPDHQLKSILKKEFDDCEKIYPFLGELFLNLFFDNKISKSRNLKIFARETANKFIETSDDENARAIATWIIENVSSDRIIDIEETHIENIIFKKEDGIFFNIEYDSDFLGSRNQLDMKDYRFTIIDGYIESVSEIHHMLHFAAKSKEPYVIFCFGMSEEVKNVIIQNNSRSITQIFPVSMSINEDTINILNDIALLHKSDVISSMKGQTISQELRKELKKGNLITFRRNGFKIDPVAEKTTIAQHVKFLQNRIENSPPDANTDLIRDRIKNLNSKVLKIYIPETLRKNVGFNRDLDYLLRMIKASEGCYLKIRFDNRELYIPFHLFKYVMKKVNITKDMFYNIDKILIRKE